MAAMLSTRRQTLANHGGWIEARQESIAAAKGETARQIEALGMRNE
jgi:hypothetical protein